MSKDDWIYLIILIISIPLSYLSTKIQNGVLRKLSTTFLGIIFAILVSGYEFFHSLIVVIGNCIILFGLKRFQLVILFSPIYNFHKKGVMYNLEIFFLFSIIYRYYHVASFVWCFGYLAIFRGAHLLGLQDRPVSGHSNAIQLFVTLRV